VKPKALIPSLLCAAAAMLFFMSCNTPPDPKYTKDGRSYGQVSGLFRERWWNFYERGLSYAEGGFWQEAVADFKEALKQRDRDQRRARTYGLHFTDYFPHRDLGIAYYSLGNFEDAQRELELSLSQAETGKAKYYLNEVRRAMLKQSGAGAAPPSVSLKTLREGQATNSFRMKIAGEVRSDAYASRVVINDEVQFVELSAKKLPFEKEIKLKKGINEIKIKSSDLLGRVTEKNAQVVGDFEGPMMNVKNFSDGQQVGQNRVVLNGTLADSTGIARLQVNEQVLAYNKEKQLEFTFAVQLKEGPNKIMLAATDAVGNTTSGQMSIVYVPRLARGRQAPDTPYWRRVPITVALKGSGIVDAGSPVMTAAAGARQTGAALHISLNGLTETQTVLFENISIDGMVSGTSDIQSVKINGSPLLVMPGRNIFFSQLVELREGENKITVEVKDAAGNTCSKLITINHQLPAVRQISSRMSIAVMPFEKTGNVSASADSAYGSLIRACADQKRFRIISSGPEFEKAMSELNLAESDLADKAAAVKLGRKLEADAVLMGTINETEGGIEVYARLIDTATSDLLGAEDVFTADKTLAQIQYMTDGLTLKFKQSFPLVEGTVAQVKGREIHADIGSALNIKKDMTFIVYREGEKIVHPVTGRELGSQTEALGTARVVNVMADASIGKLAPEFDPSKIQAGDIIITK
jgi:TolB-like protein